MTTPFPTTRIHFTSADASVAKLTKNADGTGTLKGLPVFKAGTFRDSMGEQNTWTPEHLKQMVGHFNLLKDTGSFPAPPSRVDHSRSIRNVVGYVSGLSTDGAKLFADVDLTEPDAVGKWERGTYRGRSAEIGAWTTNDEATYFPTFRGFAWVDTPAVEGLYERQDDAPVVVLTDTDKEFSVPEPQPKPTGSAAPATFTIAGKSSTDPAAVQAYISTLEAAAAAEPATFTINGEATADHAKVAAHITALETFASETRESNRKAFVEKLAADKKIGQPQVAGLTELALSFTDEQFTKFQAGYETAPVQTLFERHGNDVTNPDGDATDPVQAEIDQLEATVKMHRQSNTPGLVVEDTQSFKRLQALKSLKTSA